MPTKVPKPVKILHYGLGAVGINIARAAHTSTQLHSVAAVDISPTLTGKTLAELMHEEAGHLKKIKVQSVLKKNGAQVVLHATRSWIKDIEEELATLIRAKLHIVSTAEELVFPVGENIKIVRRLDALAKKHKVKFMATGVNPGFVLDYLPLVLSQASVRITHVFARRIVNLAERRLQLQRKVGLGITLEEFNQRCHDKRFGHQGMHESLHLLAAGLGIEIKRTHASIKPVLAIEEIRWSGGIINKNSVLGIAQEVMGYSSGKERLRLQVEMILKPESERGEDVLEVSGEPPITLRIAGGVRGEEATAAAVIHAVPRLLAHPRAGFLTMLDLGFAARPFR